MNTFSAKNICAFIQEISTTLPEDIQKALFQAKICEEGIAKLSLSIMEENMFFASQKSIPLCQDTGFLTFFITAPQTVSRKYIENEILKAVQKSTKEGILRPNAVDPLSGKNSGNNIGKGFPKIIWDFYDCEEKKNEIHISLILKGGGSENVSAQVSLPMETDFGKAGRDQKGVIKAVLQIIKNAEGKGCAPGIIGVHIGGDRESGSAFAKKNLLLPLSHENPDKNLQEIESEILSKANALGIGPMGFGGKTTLLGVHCSTSHRLPASFFVTVSYSCWALRRGEAVFSLQEGGEEKKKKKAEERAKEEFSDILSQIQNIKILSFPCSELEIRNLKKGDIVMVQGDIFTGRDALHEAVVEKNYTLPFSVAGKAVYHCGPIAILEDEKNPSSWKIISAGPTTSIREEPYEAEFIAKTGVRAVIGKGGMGKKTKEALVHYGAVYLHAIGGAAAFYAKTIETVKSVYFLEEFGIPEAMWNISVQNFLCVVTMDAREDGE